MKKLITILFAVALGLNLSAQVPDYVPTDGLVAWYSFDSTLVDHGPNGHDGQSQSFAFAEDVFGLANGALRLELGEFINLGMEDKLLNTGQDSLSITFWSKPDENAGTIITKYVNFDAPQCSWFVGDDELTGVRAFGNGYDDDEESWYMSCPNSTSGWSHIAIVFVPGSVAVWVNGDFICERAVPNSNVSNPQPILVGRSNCDGSFCNDASGLVDNVGFWDRALTPTEVEQIASGTPHMGCTDQDACNFDSEAASDDGSCIPSGCMETDACNYNALAECEGEACDYSCCPGPGCCLEGTTWDADLGGCIPTDSFCPEDLDGDGIIGVNDLMQLLSFFGTDCVFEEPETSEWTCGDPMNYHGYDYETVQIGDQCWFAENLRATNFRNGEEIIQLQSIDEWLNTDAPGWCIYEDSLGNALPSFGILYNKFVVNNNICPAGWHVPNFDDWWSGLREWILENYPEVGPGGVLKTVGTAEWLAPNEGGINIVNFDGRPSGGRNLQGEFLPIGTEANFHVNGTFGGGEAHHFFLKYENTVFDRTGGPFGGDKPLTWHWGSSIRCLKDTEE